MARRETETATRGKYVARLIVAHTARNPTMKTYEFSIIASGLDPEANDFEARFFDAGCDDATVSFQKGLIILDFAREAESFEQALESAVRNVEAAGARVDRIEPDTLVNLTDIAKRVNLTRASIHHYATGQRAEGFPAPAVRVTSDAALYDWAEVSEWFFSRGVVDEEVCVEARLVREMNAELQRSQLAAARPHGLRRKRSA
jgi:hypothetical protein